ncbi:hypothetical protein BD413DRAFT_616229 [Trametes elegans]|nr:hypothetical protein BD413DRAFT_616229 [Trametes elegans]
MAYFSRVIARPTAGMQNPGSKASFTDSLQGGSTIKYTNLLHGGLPSVAYETKTKPNPWGQGRVTTYPSEQAWWYRIPNATATKPFIPSWLTTTRPQITTVPSLCPDDGSTESLLSNSPATPESPPPTGWACMGSPGYLGSFGDEYDRPEAHPDFVRKELRAEQKLRRQARMRDGDFCNTDDEGDYSVANEATAPVVLVKEGSTPTAVPRSESPRVSLGSPSRASSRLSQRVKTPPALNTRAIKAHDLLSKLTGGTYDIEVGDVDGSPLPEDISGYETDTSSMDEDGSENDCWSNSDCKVEKKLPSSTRDNVLVVISALSLKTRKIVASGKGRGPTERTYAVAAGHACQVHATPADGLSVDKENLVPAMREVVVGV